MRNLLLSFVLILIYSNILSAQSRYQIDNFVAPSTTYSNVGPDAENITIYAKEAGVKTGGTIPLVSMEDFVSEFFDALTDTIFVSFENGISNASFEIEAASASAITLTGLPYYQGNPVDAYWGIGSTTSTSNTVLTGGNSDPKDVNLYIEAGQTIDSLVLIIDKGANTTGYLGIHGINWIATNGSRPLANPDIDMGIVCSKSLNVMFLLDNSTSISTAEFDEIRAGVTSGLTGMHTANPSDRIYASFARFGTNAEQGPLTAELDDTSLASGGTVYEWLHTVYGTSSAPEEKTNWVDAFQKAKDAHDAGYKHQLLIFFTDGMVNNNENIGDVADIANYLKGEGVHILFLGSGQMGPKIIENVAGYITRFPNPIEYDNATNIFEGDYRYMADYSELNPILSGVTGSNCAVTPVELTKFESYAEDCEVQLEWATASEIDNSHFNVERSSDGREFTTIGKVEGNGTTSDIMNYTFRDENPGKTNYYRLKQMDYDGAFEYSEVIEARASNCRSYSVYPTMPTTELTIKSNETVENELSVMVTDLTGKRVMFEDMNSRNDSQFSLDVSQLNRGIYFVSILEDGIIASTFKILK